MLVRILFMILILLNALSYASEGDKEKIYIVSDSIHFNKETRITTAKGKVVAVEGEKILKADVLEYHHLTHTYYAMGNVSFLKEDGTIFYADKLDINTELFKGRGINFASRIQGSTFVASAVDVLDKNNIELYNVTYSQCAVCKDNFAPYKPIWQFKAESAKIVKDTSTVRYKNAKVELFGIPVLYTPYFQTPTPDAKRKTGFLFPVLKVNSALGYNIKTPFYFALDQDKDLTITPWLFSNKQPVLEAQFRHILPRGYYEISGTSTYTTKTDSNGVPVDNKKSIRYNYKITSLFNSKLLGTESYFGLNTEKQKDDSRTYLKKYKISKDDILTTDLFLKSFWDDNYVFANVLDFQDLRSLPINSSTPTALPWIRANLNKNVMNGKLFLDLDTLNIRRKEGNNQSRFSVKSGYKKSMVLPYGQILSTQASVRGDFYQNYNAHENKANSPKITSKRFLPEFNARWSLPLYRSFKFSNVVLEPIVSLSLAPKLKDLSIINEDSNYFQITPNNFLNQNKYLGLDGLESGSKIAYGIKGSYHNKYIDNISIALGKVENFSKHEEYTKKSGMNTRSSDVVLEINAQPNKDFFIVNQSRFNSNRLMRNDVYAGYKVNKWNILANHSYEDNSLLDVKTYQNDLKVSVGYNFYDKWWIAGYQNLKLGPSIKNQRKKILDKAELKYLGDCFHLLFGVEVDYTSLKDLKPSTNFTIHFEIPNF